MQTPRQTYTSIILVDAVLGITLILLSVALPCYTVVVAASRRCRGAAVIVHTGSSARRSAQLAPPAASEISAQHQGPPEPCAGSSSADSSTRGESYLAL